MNRLSKDKRDKIILIAVGALAIAATYWYLVITSQAAGLEKYRESIRDADDRVNKADLRIRRTTSIEAELKTLRQQMADAEAMMIPVEQLKGNKWLFDTLVNFIAKNKHDVKPLSLSNDPLIGKQFVLLPKFAYSGAAYEVEFQAYFHSFGRFLADFENSFPYIHIQRMQIWPLATPSAATGPTTDMSDELLTGSDREQLKISLKMVLLFKPPGSP